MADNKLQDAVNRMVERLDRNVLRKMQQEGYECAARVFDNKSWSSEQLAAAVERCQMPTQQINQFMQQEMNNFQSRIQRGVQDCQDRAQDSLPAGSQPSEAQIARAQKDMEVCVNKCVDTHVALLPNLSARIEQAVKQVREQK